MRIVLSVTCLFAIVGCGQGEGQASLDGAVAPPDTAATTVTDASADVAANTDQGQIFDALWDMVGVDLEDVAAQGDVGQDIHEPTCHSYEASIQPVLNQHCVGCHNMVDGDNNLNLTQGESWNALMNTESIWGAQLKIVVPFDSENSFIMDKMSSNPSFGLIMPIKGPAGGPPMPEFRSLIGQWIDAGATDTPMKVLRMRLAAENA